ncbi:MAG: DapH/DapD/GlmU-related protein [candidate division WOR-3 bacterium]|jgi:acetyltransferase-like isoleucine patch superfamily enzyme|nr:hypothetical protein [candidate division WOR-3 bacterium]MDH7519599.1 DapH/DapD/GlmU-related protein [bacterium]
MDMEVKIGSEVKIDCPELILGANCSIGIPEEENLSPAPKVLIRCSRLELGTGCVIAPGVVITGGSIKLDAGCRISSGVTIRVQESLELGKNSVIGPNSLIEGIKIKIGRELWCGPYVRIGGGSCFEPQSLLTAGYWLHLGMRAFINTARPVTIGNEVGIGTNSAIYTHGAYQSILMGFPVAFAPVTIGDNCWLPGATVNPGVTIGANTVIGVGSVVTKSIPAGALAAGVPCRVLKENVFPRPLSEQERRAFFLDFLPIAGEILAHQTKQNFQFLPQTLTLIIDTPTPTTIAYQDNTINVVSGETPATIFHLGERAITGTVTPITEKLRDLLRRYGIRFKSEPVDGNYQPWVE